MLMRPLSFLSLKSRLIYYFLPEESRIISCRSAQFFFRPLTPNHAKSFNASGFSLTHTVCRIVLGRKNSSPLTDVKTGGREAPALLLVPDH